MLSRRILTARTLQAVAPIARQTTVGQFRCASQNKRPESEWPSLTEAEDPEMNGGYVNPPRIKRHHRDPHGDWWDKQERRNYGEPVHEDNDEMSMFSLHDYTFFSMKGALFGVGCFITGITGIYYATSYVYPDKKSYPKEYEGGLERELGGPGAHRARAPGDPYEWGKL